MRVQLRQRNRERVEKGRRGGVCEIQSGGSVTSSSWHILSVRAATLTHSCSLRAAGTSPVIVMERKRHTPREGEAIKRMLPFLSCWPWYSSPASCLGRVRSAGRAPRMGTNTTVTLRHRAGGGAKGNWGHLNATLTVIGTNKYTESLLWLLFIC